MAATDIVFEGYYYAVGCQVQAWIAGLNCGLYTVSATGTVTVPINSDPNKLCSGAYLAQFDVGPYDHTTYGEATQAVTLADGVGGIQTIYIPVVIGFAYPHVGQLLRGMLESDIKSPLGGGLGKTRRAAWVMALLQNTQGIEFGTSTGQYDTAPLDDGAGNVLPLNQLYSGVWSKPLDDNYTEDGMVGWRVEGPYPCAVVSLSYALDVSER